MRRAIMWGLTVLLVAAFALSPVSPAFGWLLGSKANLTVADSSPPPRMP